ncbi:unnamed protein product [Plutella xylostella]|nr:unnamed protein product [Plutella xylostella]
MGLWSTNTTAQGHSRILDIAKLSAPGSTECSDTTIKTFIFNRSYTIQRDQCGTSDENNYDINIYIDGAKNKKGSGGGVFCPELNLQYSVSFGNKATVFQAEAASLLDGATQIKDTKNSNICFYTDSMAILASQSLQLFWWKITGGGVGVSYCVWMLLIGLLLCPVMWLGSPKDMKPLAFSSVFIVSTVAISTWTCILLDVQSPRSRGGVLDHQPGTQDFLIAYGIIAFQFDIHPMLLTIQVDMKDSTRINRAVFLGFFFTGTMFAVTTVLAAYRYGLDVDYNILQGIPASIPLYVVSLLVTLQLCLSSAVGNSALFQHVEDLLKIPRHFCVQRCMLRSGIVALAVFLGEAVPRFDVVMGLVGSTLTGPLMFIFPPLFFLKLSYMKNYLAENDPDFPFKPKLMLSSETDVYQNGDNELSLSKVPRTVNGAFKSYKTFGVYEDLDVDFRADRIKWYEVALSGTVMVMGISATVVATYVSWSDAIRYATFTPPCLVNVTAAARSFLEVTKS